MKTRSFITHTDQRINLNKLTVFVGPNNSGKSQTLKDIKETLEKGEIHNRKLIKTVVFEWPKTFDDLTKNLNLHDAPHSLHMLEIAGLKSDLLSPDTTSFGKDIPENYDSNDLDKEELLGPITQFSVAYLNSENRLRLGSSAESINIKHDSPTKIIQTLINDFETEDELKNIFKKAFGMDIKFDVSALSSVNFLVSEKMPVIDENPRKAIDITTDIPKLDDQGDGFRSFVGIIIGLLQSNNRIILLDEPEAFLHPAQARILGKWISSNLDKFSSQILISTHSSNFLQGLLSGDDSIDIFRLNRIKNDETKFDLIPKATTKELAKHPLLSSQRVLEAIFYKGAVICEADADRAIYHGVSTVEFENNDILFLHGHSKDTLWNVAQALQKANVPVAAIADIDILNAKKSFERLVEAITSDKAPENIKKIRNDIATSVESRSEEEMLAALRGDVEEFLIQDHELAGARRALLRIHGNATKWSNVKKSGIGGFDDAIKSKVLDIFDFANKAGLFIVPVGELERWMDLGSAKNKWVIPALEKVYAGESPQELKDFIKMTLDWFNQSDGLLEPEAKQ